MQGVEPVLRTYNTLIIACNMCGQPREAMAVYKRMLDEGYSPNATTYNALISAYGKAGQLDKVLRLIWSHFTFLTEKRHALSMCQNPAHRSTLGLKLCNLSTQCPAAGWKIGFDLEIDPKFLNTQYPNRYS
jgi:pentatricopeptide repeat protein